jgi:hypothetical protein
MGLELSAWDQFMLQECLLVFFITLCIGMLTFVLPVKNDRWVIFARIMIVTITSILTAGLWYHYHSVI